jgi:hypothetical protein
MATEASSAGRNPVANLDDYGLRHLAAHLAQSGRDADLHRLLRLEWHETTNDGPAAVERPTRDPPILFPSPPRSPKGAVRPAIWDRAGAPMEPGRCLRWSPRSCRLAGDLRSCRCRPLLWAPKQARLPKVTCLGLRRGAWRGPLRVFGQGHRWLAVGALRRSPRSGRLAGLLLRAPIAPAFGHQSRLVCLI